MAIAAVKVNWVSSDDKTGESEVGAHSNALLMCLLLFRCCGANTLLLEADVVCHKSNVKQLYFSKQ